MFQKRFQIDSDERDFVGVISSKCKVYHGMKNRQPYMCVAIVLRNLLTNGDKFEADHLKAICLFFEGCLDTNNDDSNAMRLLGKTFVNFLLKVISVSQMNRNDETFMR